MSLTQPLLLFAFVVVLYLLSSIKILTEYERGVIFRLGKLLPQPKGPGVILVFTPIDRIVRVSLRTIVMDVAAAGRHHPRQRVGQGERGRVLPGHGPAPRDRRRRELPLRHDRSWRRRRCAACWGRCELDDLLSQRERLNQQLQQILDQHTDPWGIKVSAVEVKHVDLPADMQRAMAQAGRSRAREAC